MLLIGDSLLQHVRKPMTVPCEPVETHIVSIGGCTIDRLIALMQKDHFRGLVSHQKHVVLMIGTNTLAREKSQSAIVKVKELVQIIHRKYPFLQTVALCTVPARTRTSIFYRAYGDNGGKSIRKRIKKYNHKLKRLRKKLRVAIIELTFDPAKHLSPDGLHPNGKGIGHISDVLQTYADTIRPTDSDCTFARGDRV